jgi:hypothetical protein
MQEIFAPKNQRLNLDTSLHMFAIDDKGKPIVDDDGKHVQIAQDIVTGKWYRRASDSLPYNKKPKLEQMIEDGAVHFSHRDERFRGVWIPLSEAKTPSAAKK